MNKTNPILKSYALFGILFTFIVGSLSHFIYDLSGYLPIVGYFFPTTESVWEHLKLGFYAWFLYGIGNYCFLNDKANNYWLGILLSSLAGNLFIIFFFYTYTGVLGHSILVLDIASYLLSCMIAAYVYYKILTQSPLSSYVNGLSVILLLLVCSLFAFWTYQPPNLPLFKDLSVSKNITSTVSSSTA